MWKRVLLNFSIVAAFSALSGGLYAKPVPIRSLKTPCEFYLVDKSQRMMGESVTTSLSTEELRSWLASKPTVDPQTQALYAVGAPLHRKDLATLETEVRAALAEHGQADLEFKTIRRIANFIQEQSGLFSIHVDGTYEKLADLDAALMQTAIANAAPEKLESLAIMGAPLFSSERKDLENLVQAALAAREAPPAELSVESKPLVILREFMRRPAEAVKHLADQLRYWLPMSEDWQRPTRAELGSMTQKLVIPGVLTFSVLYSVGQPLKVLIPVTIVNAMNSAFAGTVRTFIGNWFSRSKNLFPGRILKQFAFSAFFTANLYWAASGSMENLGKILTFAGWMHLIQSKWLSNLFQTSWRMPVQDAIYSWERGRAAEGVNSGELRYKGSVIEKYLSYLMTQFYIWSIVSPTSLFKVVSGSEHIFNPANYKALPGETMLMEFNYGHVGMASAGILAALLLRKMSVMDGLSKGLAWLDRGENWLYRSPLSLYKWVKGKVKETFFRPSEPSSVEGSPKGSEKE